MKLRKQSWRGDGLFAVLLSGSLLWIFSLMNGASFFFDEWDFILRRGFNVDDLLRPHNGHFSLIPVLIFVLLRKIFGLSNYVPYQIAALMVHACVCVAVYVIVRNRSQVLALCAALVVCLLGSGWQNILWPFQIGMMGAFGVGLWAFYEIDRDDIKRWRLSLFLGLSLACAGGGIAVTAVVIAVLLVKKQWRVISAQVPVLVLYGMWYLKYGQSQSQDGNLGKTPKYILDSALAAGAGTGSKSLIFGGFVVGVVLVLALLKQRELKFTSLPNVIVVFLLATWGLTGLSRAHLGEPGASRYVYVGATCLILLFALVVPVVQNLTTSAGLFIAAIFLVSPNMSLMRAGANGLLDTSTHVRAELSAIEHVRMSLLPGYVIDSARAPQLNIGEYLSAIDRFGSPAFSWNKLSTLPSGTLIDVNRTLAEASHFLQLLPDAQCVSSSSVAKEEIDLKPKSSVTMTIKAPRTLKFNWFKESPDAAYAIEISKSGTYVLQNLIEKESNVLNVSGDMQSVTICKQS
jgi:hypothetical protein